jgi:hypothetical protein
VYYSDEWITSLARSSKPVPTITSQLKSEICDVRRQLDSGNRLRRTHQILFQTSTPHLLWIPTSPIMLFKLLASVAGTLGAYALCTVIRSFYLERTSPLQWVPGPRSSHWLLGNLKEVMHAEVRGLDYLPQEKWTSRYGRTIRFNSFVGVSAPWYILHRNFTTDFICGDSLASCILWTPRR